MPLIYDRDEEKLQAGPSEYIAGRDSILIDRSSWYRGSFALKIGTIQDAIEMKKTLRFRMFRLTRMEHIGPAGLRRYCIIDFAVI